jgi:hypothetical protein
LPLITFIFNNPRREVVISDPRLALGVVDLAFWHGNRRKIGRGSADPGNPRPFGDKSRVHPAFHFGIDTMLVEQIDVIGLQASQAASHSGPDMGRLSVNATLVDARIGVDVQPNLVAIFT